MEWLHVLNTSGQATCFVYFELAGVISEAYSDSRQRLLWYKKPFPTINIDRRGGHMPEGLLISVWFTLGAAFSAIVLPHRWIRYTTPTLLALAGISVTLTVLPWLTGTPSHSWESAFGLPWLKWQFRLDALSALFSLIIGVLVVLIAPYIPAYLRHDGHGKSQRPLLAFTSTFILGMFWVTWANDAFSFMIAWELMSVSSFFLVCHHHEDSANRRAGFLYMLMAHVGAIAILLSFAVFAAHAHSFTFDAARELTLSPGWATLAFALALLGFGMKAGLIPVHVWLPEAHPVAPSFVSALMSGVMLKVAVYGFLRVALDLSGEVYTGWGVTVMLIGAVTALYGILHATVQSEIKRLLAYSSIENIGIIFFAIGMALIFLANGHTLYASLAFVAALAHAVNHALYKSLMFLAAGAVIQMSRQSNIERMGGLLRLMPFTGAFFLLGTLAITALPPLNGFVSEWLTLQAALQSIHLESGILRSIVPLAAALIILTSAISIVAFTKLFGIAFLGRPRHRQTRRSKPAPVPMVVSFSLITLACLIIGVQPQYLIGLLTEVPGQLFNGGLPEINRHGWLWITPVSSAVASYSAPLVFTGISLSVFIWWCVYQWLKRHHGEAAHPRVPAWGCGFGGETARTQYSGYAFSMPLQRILQGLWVENDTLTEEPSPHEGLLPVRKQFQSGTQDRIWFWLYLPVAQMVNRGARLVSRMQTGRVRHYLAYSFFTLVVLLWINSGI
ncbi:MAG: hydrogenase 4 subunit B [Gammaproteobacteria bacterium]|nr:MAG: hydrogenase 4 subunit B [Gammaproteobacteria bacterium]